MENIYKQNNIIRKNKSKGKKRFRFRFGKRKSCNNSCLSFDGSLAKANINKEYIIKSVETNNEEIKEFLFTLGCYQGEKITVISIISDQYIVVIKDARYSIDKNLASCIII